MCDAHENRHRLEQSSLQHEAQALKTKRSQFVPVTEAAARSAELQKRARSDRQNKKLTNYF